MDLWQIFVLAQTRLALNISYDRLHMMANYNTLLRQLLGVEFTKEMNFEKIEIEYQNIIDNVHLLTDDILKKINEVIVEMGHNTFKKKEQEALRLKSDSFVVKSNVHFPTDYNLLWDSARKSLSVIGKISNTYKLQGWRKINDWFTELKKLVREVSQSSKKSEENKKEVAKKYIQKANKLSNKIKIERPNLPLNTKKDMQLHIELDYYEKMLDKHIELFERRVIKGEKIEHEEKIFSIFEPYTEWINKGKSNPNFELGKNILITTDQFHLIIDFQIMEKQKDNHTVISLANRVLDNNKVESWSFDKGFYSKENKELLNLYIPKLVMPKKGKLNQQEYEQEHQKEFIKTRHKHSAVESNINELEHRGLDRCPDRTYQHFKNYIALGVCAYNLHKIGAELLKQQRQKEKLRQAA
jgi:hypothetical protein